MMKIRVLSLFDGIACAHEALDRADFVVDKYFASEVDMWANQIAKRNHPDIIQLGNVKAVTKKKVGKIDLLIGGSPCQDLSIAKQGRKGLDGDRSGLFWEYVRILHEVKPKYFILENVASMHKSQQEIISKALGVQPIMINAALVSAQTRKRLFWTNIKDISSPVDRGILLKDILEDKDFYGLYSDYNNSTVYDKSRTIGTGCGTVRSATCQQVITKPVRIAKIDRGGQGDRVYSVEGKSVNLSANGGGRGAKTGLYAVPVALRNRGSGKKPEYNGTGKANAITSVQTDSIVSIIQRGRGFNKGGKHFNKSPTLTSNSFQHNNHVAVKDYVRKLTPIECERLQGLPDNYTMGITATERYKVLGNAFNVDVITHILSFIKCKAKK